MTASHLFTVLRLLCFSKDWTTVVFYSKKLSGFRDNNVCYENVYKFLSLLKSYIELRIGICNVYKREQPDQRAEDSKKKKHISKAPGVVLLLCMSSIQHICLQYSGEVPHPEPGVCTCLSFFPILIWTSLVSLM